MAKESIFKKIFSSNKDCCSVEIEEISDTEKDEENMKVQDDSECCSSKTE